MSARSEEQGTRIEAVLDAHLNISWRTVRTSRPTTIQDVERLPDDSYRYELVEGVLLRMPPNEERHSDVGMTLLKRLIDYDAETHGSLYISGCGFILQRDPNTLLAPDIAFVRAERVRPPHLRIGYVPYEPDLAVDIISVFDRHDLIARKVDAYRAAGTRLLWVIDSVERVAWTYPTGEDPRMLGESDTLDGGDVLPGFRVVIRDLFR